MWPYWLFFGLSSLIALNSAPNNHLRQDMTRRIRVDETWLLIILLITLMLGFRYQVGGDWYAYLRHFEIARQLTFLEALTHDDPAYYTLNYLVAQFDGTIVSVNLFLGLFFSTGVVVFCRSLPRPWLALTVAFPYLILIVGMGFTRQGIALSFSMIGIVALSRGRFAWFLVWILLGALFHKTAIVMIALGATSVNRNHLLWIPIIGIFGLSAYTLLLADYTDELIYGYVTKDYASSGALVRLSMNLVPAILFFFYRNRFSISPVERKFWSIASLTSIVLFIALVLGAPSTALDRMALYLLPLQLFVFAHLPDVLGVYGRRNTTLLTIIIAYYALVLFVWLNFATNAPGWVPYQVWTGG